MILYDAQTSGGLLIAVAPEKAEILLDQLTRNGVMDASILGEIIPDRICTIRVSN